MKQKSISVFNINLAYLDKNEDKEHILFFIHGNSASANSWKAQLNSELFENYRLIAIDLPAHGHSDVSSNPVDDYSLPNMGKIMATAIKILADGKPYVLVGISLGTNIISESLAFDLEPQGVVLGASCVIGRNYKIDDFAYPNTNIHVVFTEQAQQEEVKKYASQVMKNKNNIEGFIVDYYRVKQHFRSCLINSIQQQKYSDQISLLQAENRPLLVIFGLGDKIINPNYLDDTPFNLWNNTIYKIPEASHFVHSDQPKQFNKLLSKYVADIFKT